MDEIRLGTIGSGPIVHWILNNVAKTDGILLTAVYSRTSEKGNALAAAYGAPKVYTDMDDFLLDEEVNFVYIATPNILHYEQAKRALLAGKHVILEKPFCTRASQAAELVKLARENGLFLVDAVPTTFLPNYDILQNQLPRIGRIRLVLGSYSQYSSRYNSLLRGEVPNVFNPAFGGGCLMDLNFYNIYLNVALFGKPKEISYFPNIYPNLADTSGTAILRYEDFISQCSAAKDTWGENSFQIQGESGYIRVKDGCNGLAEIEVVTGNSRDLFNAQPNPDRWYYEVREVVRLIRAGDNTAFDQRLALMLDVMEVLEAARKSAGIRFPGDEET